LHAAKHGTYGSSKIHQDLSRKASFTCLEQRWATIPVSEWTRGGPRLFYDIEIFYKQAKKRSGRNGQNGTAHSLQNVSEVQEFTARGLIRCSLFKGKVTAMLAYNLSAYRFALNLG
jgi:hypothetical protein